MQYLDPVEIAFLVRSGSDRNRHYFARSGFVCPDSDATPFFRILLLYCTSENSTVTDTHNLSTTLLFDLQCKLTFEIFINKTSANEMMKTQKETFLDFDLEMQFSPGQNASSDRRGGGEFICYKLPAKSVCKFY